MHHKNPSRDGVYIEPALTKAAVAGLKLDTTFKPTIGSEAIYSQPLFVDRGGTGKDLVVVATESNNVYALDAATGSQVWKTPLGASVPLSMMSCGNIDLFGVTSTPVIDFASQTVFVGALVLPPGVGSVPKHEIFALSLANGGIEQGWPVDVAAQVGTAAVPFNAKTTGQRGALALVGGTLYVPYGGLYGDCPTYHGRVVAVSISDPTKVQTWATTAAAGGIWAPGGISSDGSYLYASTGNTQGTATWGGGDALIRLGVGAAFTNAPAYFAPTNWHDLDNGDLDMGTAPIPFDLAGSTPSHLVIMFGKDGKAYLLDRTTLNGVGSAIGAKGGSFATATVATNEIITAPVLYQTSTATYVSFKGNNSACGGAGTLTTYKITPGSPPTLNYAWCGGSGNGSPMVTTTDGKADAIVWFPAAEGSNRLQAFDGDTGAAVPFTASTSTLSGMRRFNTPIAAKGKIYVATDGNVIKLTP